jgi:hypothetical protein
MGWLKYASYETEQQSTRAFPAVQCANKMQRWIENFLFAFFLCLSALSVLFLFFSSFLGSSVFTPILPEEERAKSPTAWMNGERFPTILLHEEFGSFLFTRGQHCKREPLSPSPAAPL